MARPLMPWQHYTATVATERLGSPLCPACQGAPMAHSCPYRYPVVVVYVPRQSGKTTLVGAVATERCIDQDGHQWFYTAQKGKDAKERWNDLVKLMNASPLRSQIVVRRSAGSERVVFPNLSELRVFAPTADSLHGYTPPSVCLDEAMAHDEELGDALMGAIGPAQITLADRQLWIVSTAGTADSVFLDRWVEAGRAGVDGVALFDWGAADGVDVYDPSELVRFHPALGLAAGNGTTVDAILAQAKLLSRSEYERAYGNRPVRTEAHEIPPEAWDDLAKPQQPPPGPLLLQYDVAQGGLSSTITATWRDAAGVPNVKVVRWDSGTHWVAEAIQDYTDRWNVIDVAADDSGPSRNVTDQLRLTGRGRARRVTTLSARDLTVAWAQLLEAVRTEGMVHDGSEQLAHAAASVVSRPVLDASAPSRRASPGDIAPLVAAMVGLHRLDRLDGSGPETGETLIRV